MAAAAEGASCWWRMECAREWKAGRERDQMKAGASVEAMTSERSGKIGGRCSGDDATSLVSEKTRVRFGAAAQIRHGCRSINGSRREEERDVWGYLLASRGSVGAFGVVAATTALEKGEKGGKGKGGDGRKSERIEAAAVLPFSRVAVFPSCGCRRRPPAAVVLLATVAAPPLSTLPPRLPASRRFASPRKRDDEKEEGDDVDYADMWGPRGSHANSDAT
uniref:Uncharacterized protein n=1 Tax=Oryza nivara TaxID=4536 RepID=A0A0E0HMF5_ORYNI